MHRALALFAVLLVSARQEPQEDTELAKAVALLQTDAARGVKALEAIVAKDPKAPAASGALIALARHWLQPPGDAAKALDALRRYSASFAENGLDFGALGLVEKALGKRFTTQPTFSFGEYFGFVVQPRNVTLAQYRLMKIDAAFVRAELRAGRDPVSAPRREVRGEWTRVQRFDLSDPNPVRISWNERLGTGYYVFEEEIDGFTCRWPARHDSATLLVKDSASQVFVYAFKSGTGEPIPGLELERHGTAEGKAVTDSEGRAVLPAGEGRVLGLLKDETLSCWTIAPGLENPDVVSITTDRPIYRPGQTVHFRAILRDRKGRTLSRKQEKAFTVEIEDGEEHRVYRRELAQSSFGTISDSFQLGDEPALGSYSIIVRDAHQGDTPDMNGELWARHTAHFKVAAYRKPEIKVEIGAASSAKPGEKVKARIEAHYLFGPPAAGAAVHWQVATRVVWGERDPEQPAIPKDHPFAWYVERRSEDSGWDGGAIAKGSGVTDKDGRLEIEFQSQESDRDLTYTVSAEVTDESRRPAEGKAEIIVPRSEARLRFIFGRNFYRAGQQAVLHVVATDLRGVPLPDRKIVLRAFENEKEEYEECYRGESATDRAGAARFEPRIDKPGRVRFKAVMGKTTARAHLWAAGEDLPARDPGPLDLTVLPEFYVYQAGEKANFFVCCSERHVRALLTVETDRVLESRSLTLAARGSVIDVPLPAEAAPTAIVRLHVWGKEGYADNGARLLIVPKEKWLDVSVKTDRTSYRPHEKAKLSIAIHDGNGKPVEAEVSLGVVDEAIYLLEPDRRADIRREFYPPDLDVMHTSGTGGFRPGDNFFDPFSRYSSGGTPLTGATLSLEESKESVVGGIVPAETRRWFPDTLLWNPAVKTDAQGHADLELEVADSMTTWVFTAQAIGTAHQVGQGKSTTLVRKNVVAQLVAPRTLTQDDEATVSVLVHNDLDEKEEFAVSLEAKGAEIVGKRESREAIAAHGVKRVDWRVRAKTFGAATFTVKALGTKESDAMELDVPVKPRGILRVECRSGRVEESVTEHIAVPKEAVAPELTIVVSPGAGPAVLEALPYLAGYPYGCVEQTMSRFLPSLMTQRALAKLGLHVAKLDEELPKMLHAGLQRLYEFQHADGGWGWWKHDSTNRWMTAYVVLGLSEARAAGVPVEERTLSKGVEALKAMLAEKPEAYLLWALAHESELPPDAVKALREAKLEPRDRLYFALALLQKGRKNEARPLLLNLRVADPESTALFLKAIVSLDVSDRRLGPLVQQLLSARRGPAWVSTRDSAFAIYALTDYLVASGEPASDNRFVVTVNGKDALRGAVTKETLADFNGTVRLTDLKSDNEVTIRGSKGALYYSVRLKYYAGGDALRPCRGAVVVARRYDRVARNGNTEILEPLEPGSEVKPGEVIEVTVTLRSETGCSNVLLEDPIPAGCEAVEESDFYWDWWYCRREYRDDRVSIAANAVESLPQPFTYRLRAMIPGVYHALPAQASDMYDPTKSGSSGEFELRIAEK